ncbi:MAG: tetraacyldisaccharide 4'-kinase, partial [Planctomycetota bacterium]
MKAKRYHEIISGQARGKGAALVRLVLSVVAFFYSFAIGVRNLLYDWKLLPRKSAPCPVVSIGNITAGGTGKTPCVIFVVRKLIARGAKPAVVTRGYGPPLQADEVPPNVVASGGRFGEEVALLARELPQIPIVVDPNRARGAAKAVAEHGADVVVLDDGFQHRRLKRDLDIVLIDAMRPFG